MKPIELLLGKIVPSRNRRNINLFTGLSDFNSPGRAKKARTVIVVVFPLLLMAGFFLLRWRAERAVIRQQIENMSRELSKIERTKARVYPAHKPAGESELIPPPKNWTLFLWNLSKVTDIGVRIKRVSFGERLSKQSTSSITPFVEIEAEAESFEHVKQWAHNLSIHVGLHFVLEKIDRRMDTGWVGVLLGSKG